MTAGVRARRTLPAIYGPYQMRPCPSIRVLRFTLRLRRFFPSLPLFTDSCPLILLLRVFRTTIPPPLSRSRSRSRWKVKSTRARFFRVVPCLAIGDTKGRIFESVRQFILDVSSLSVWITILLLRTYVWPDQACLTYFNGVWDYFLSF